MYICYCCALFSGHKKHEFKSQQSVVKENHEFIEAFQNQIDKIKNQESIYDKVFRRKQIKEILEEKTHALKKKIYSKLDEQIEYI